jgi:hypothetical protein
MKDSYPLQIAVVIGLRAVPVLYGLYWYRTTDTVPYRMELFDQKNTGLYGTGLARILPSSLRPYYGFVRCTGRSSLGDEFFSSFGQFWSFSGTRSAWLTVKFEHREHLHSNFD